MGKGNSSSGCSGGFAILLTVAFAILKLAKVIAISWFWVFSPVIFYAAIVFLRFLLSA